MSGRAMTGFGVVWLELAVMPTKINVKFFRYLGENNSKREKPVLAQAARHLH